MYITSSFTYTYIYAKIENKGMPNYFGYPAVLVLSVLGLDVGNINIGSNAMDIVAGEQPDQEYDEIALISKAGIDVSVIKGLEITYHHRETRR